MADFTYEAIDQQGRKVNGTEHAASQEAVVDSLVSKGLQPVRIKKLHSLETLVIFKRKPVSMDDVLYFTSELADLLEAGVPLERSLTILADATEKTDVRKLIIAIRDSIHGGKSLSEALGEYPDLFDKLYVSMIKVGELGGVLPAVLKRLSDFMERSRQIRKFIISSSIYPSILAFVGLISVIILMVFVVPKFGKIFEDLNQPMPAMTKMILDTSLFLQKWWWLIILGILLAVFLVRFQLRKPEGRLWWDETKLKLPVVRRFVKLVELGRFARTLGTLIESGVPILKGISLAGEVVGNTVIKQAVNGLYRGVRQGRSLSMLMRRSTVFPSIMVHLVSVGEETGGLARMLLKIANDFENQVQSETKMFLNMLEPITIVVMGVVIGGIIMSMLLAIFGINDVTF